MLLMANPFAPVLRGYQLFLALAMGTGARVYLGTSRGKSRDSFYVRDEGAAEDSCTAASSSLPSPRDFTGWILPRFWGNYPISSTLP